jgi:hypothetical protein
MYETESIVMTPEEELVDVLLDFIIVSATLAKKVNMTVKQKQKQKQIKEGGTVNGKNQRIGNGNQRPANRSDHY